MTKRSTCDFLRPAHAQMAPSVLHNRPWVRLCSLLILCVTILGDVRQRQARGATLSLPSVCDFQVVLARHLSEASMLTASGFLGIWGSPALAAHHGSS